jgi:signal transduction histidine kinase
VELEFVNFGSGLVRVNPDQLFQVLLNLVDNAVKYSAARPKIKIVSQESQVDGYMDVLVIDNGIGIAEEDLSKIFEQFRRVEELEDVEGSGLGLFVSKKIIEMMGGQIWVTSKKGQGSTFGLRLLREYTN